MDTPDKIYIADHNANVETGLIIKGYQQSWAKIKSEDYPVIIAMRMAGYPNKDIATKYNVCPSAIHYFFRYKPYLRLPNIDELKREANNIVSRLPNPQKVYRKWKTINLWSL